MTDIPRLKDLRVLIVEDDVMISMLVRDMLGDVGCVVAGAALDLDEALDMIDRLGFDRAILDIDLGGAPSFPAADQLRDRGIPLAYATGHGRGVLRPMDRATLLLHKPFREQDAIDVLDQLSARVSG
jgi:CheY-like chemotaxis protein